MRQGMFRKQFLFGGTRLDQWTEFDSPFILWDARILDEKVPTDLGDATKTELLVSTLDAAGYLEWVGTLASPIAGMAAEATPDDFPCIVKVVKVPSSYQSEGNLAATSLEFVAPFNAPVDLEIRMKDDAPLPENVARMALPTSGKKTKTDNDES